MAHIISSRVLAAILLQTLTNFEFGMSAIRIGSSLIIPDTTSEHLQPFENCTTMVFTPKNSKWNSFSNPTNGPIALLEYQEFTNLRRTKTIFPKFSIQVRRNPAPHCWTTFAILPEKSGLFSSDHNQEFMLQPYFVEANWQSQYFIWVTTIKSGVQEYIAHIQI